MTGEGIIRFEKPPLEEIVAEVRWDPPGAVEVGREGGGAPVRVVRGTDAEFDLWACELRRRLADIGYATFQRAMDHQELTLAHKVVFRYLRNPETRFPMAQFGHGVFAFNGGKPTYTEWESFAREAADAWRALADSAPGERRRESTRLALKNINIFGAELRGANGNRAFLATDLGFGLQVPCSALRNQDGDQLVVVSGQVRTRRGDPVTLTIQAGTVASGPGGKDTAVELSAALDTPVPLEADALRAAFGEIHEVLREAFMEMTAGMHDRMRPVRGGEASP